MLKPHLENYEPRATHHVAYQVVTDGSEPWEGLGPLKSFYFTLVEEVNPEKGFVKVKFTQKLDPEHPLAEPLKNAVPAIFSYDTGELLKAPSVILSEDKAYYLSGWLTQKSALAIINLWHIDPHHEILKVSTFRYEIDVHIPALINLKELGLEFTRLKGAFNEDDW